jgi:hypothetical protein
MEANAAATEMKTKSGLTLSRGGSRAIAFHPG